MRLERELIGELQRVKARTGCPVTEQVRRALRDWLSRQKPGTHTRTTKGRR